jgi:integrase
MRDYNSLLQALLDFQLLRNKLEPINCITSSWVNEFLKFLSIKHPSKVHYKVLKDNIVEVIKGLFDIEEERKMNFRFKKEYVRIITKGELCDNTMNKRIDCLFQFFKYLESINILKLGFDASEFRRKYNRYEIEISTLTFEEIKMLKNFDIYFDFEDGRYKYVRDIFVLMCYTSLRYSDIYTLNKNRDIDNNGKAIDKVLQKTMKFKTRATIPLNETTENILKRYNYKLDRYSNTLYNRYLTEFFQKGGLFQENFYPIRFIDGKQTNCKPIPRYKALTSHAGRRTCITNLINMGYHPLQIMPITGHRSEKMLIKYYDKFRNKGAEATKMINEYDNAVNSSREIELNSKNNDINNAK